MTGSSIFIILGWIVFIWNSNRILSRTETRNLINKIVSQLNDIREIGCNHWSPSICPSENVKIVEKKILFSLSVLEANYALLQSSHQTVECDEISKLKGLLTLDIERTEDIERTDRFTDADRSARVVTILDEFEKIINKTEAIYQGVYPKYSTIHEAINEIKEHKFTAAIVAIAAIAIILYIH